ncbi:MAG: porin [Gammaproteobacteria bacterium]|nr:MAG: porin [Gammaproteobacteria bacterium]
MKKNTLPLAILIALSGVTSIQAQEIEVGKTTFSVHGYIKVDAMFTEYNDGIPVADAIDDFYIPSLIPTRAAGSVNTSEGVKFNSHAKQTRFNLASSTVLANGEKITGFIEMDFGPGNAPSNGEATTNRSGVDLRHAFISYGKWKFGQTWTNALNGSAIAETLDFFALSEGMIDTRQMQVRYTNGPLSVSLENPETTVGRVQTNNSSIPDLIVKYNFKGDWGNVSVAGIARQLKYKDAGLNIDSSEGAGGISISGRINAVGKDDIRFTVTSGKGLGRYLGLALNADAYVDGSNELTTIDQTAANIGYRHFWSDTTRSTLGYAIYDADADAAAPVYNKKSQSIHANLLFSPMPKLTLGGEYIYGKLEKSNGNTGDLNRLQFSAKYSF